MNIVIIGATSGIGKALFEKYTRNHQQNLPCCLYKRIGFSNIKIRVLL